MTKTIVKPQAVKNVSSKDVKSFASFLEKDLFGNSASLSDKRTCLQHTTLYARIPIKKDNTSSCVAFLKELNNPLIYVDVTDEFCYVAGSTLELLENLEPNYFEILKDNLVTDLTNFEEAVVRQTLYIESSLENFLEIKRYGKYLTLTEMPIEEPFDMIEPSWWNCSDTTKKQKEDFIKSVNECTKNYRKDLERDGGIPTQWNIKQLHKETCVRFYLTGFTMDIKTMLRSVINSKTMLMINLKSLVEVMKKVL